MRALALAFLIACNAPAPQSPPGSPEALAAYLRTVAGADEATRQHAVTGWILDEHAFDRIVVPPFTQLWKDYAAHFDAEMPALVTRLAARGAITTRRHYAGDPRLTNAQVRVRWALPVQYPSVVAELDGAPIDTVFVWDGSGWRVLAGVDDLVVQRVRTLDPHCADQLLKSGPPGQCTDVGWFVATSALKGDQAGFARACQLAANVCGNETP
ncbi:MAG TPA: hypothetical protein VLT45_04045 [Kofleriaceae bacterium]|nr:hypothetical protein [Kofleriaceae bacterium]